MSMMADLYHIIIHNPKPEEADTITITAMVEGYDSTFTITSSMEEFTDESYPCESKGELYDFLSGDAGLDENDAEHGVLEVIFEVSDATCPESNDYSPGCALQVSLFILRLRKTGPASAASNFVVKSFPRKMYEKVSSTDAEECTVCLEEFNNGARVVTLPCDHYFHDECAVKWFKTDHVCPLCRFELPCRVTYEEE